MDLELPLRIRVLQPLKDVSYFLQQGKGELVAPVQDTEAELVFELTVRLGKPRADGGPNLLGPFVQGPPAGRFVYINSGTLAGQPDSPWTRRAKVPLTAITGSMIEELLATPSAVLEVRIAGVAKDGGPAHATVPLLDRGWTLVR